MKLGQQQLITYDNFCCVLLHKFIYITFYFFKMQENCLRGVLRKIIKKKNETKRDCLIKYKFKFI